LNTTLKDGLPRGFQPLAMTVDKASPRVIATASKARREAIQKKQRGVWMRHSKMDCRAAFRRSQ